MCELVCASTGLILTASGDSVRGCFCAPGSAIAARRALVEGIGQGFGRGVGVSKKRVARIVVDGSEGEGPLCSGKSG
jgi:hypothetical protein